MPSLLMIKAIQRYAELHGINDDMDTKDAVAAGDTPVNRHTLNAMLGLALLVANTDESDGCGNCIGCSIRTELYRSVVAENRRLVS